MSRSTLFLLIVLLTAGGAGAGEFDRQLRTDPPRSGRIIASDGDAINEADHLRRMPINIARGLAPGYHPFGSYGERTSAGAESTFPIWPDGALQFLPAGGVQLSIQSTSAADSAAGSNIRSVEVHYLDRYLNEESEFVILNGLTSVLTKATDIRWVQCMHVNTYGATSANAAGTITGTYAGGTYSIIAAGDNRCSSSFRMVPKGKRLFVDGAVGASTSATADTTTRMRIVATEIDSHVYQNNPPALIPHASVGLQNNAVAFTFPPGLSFREGTLVGCTHTTNKAATAYCTWFGRLEPLQ